MKTLQTYYRAFEEYKEKVLKDRHIQDMLFQLTNLGALNVCKVYIETTRCEVCQDWLDEIESKLEYVEKAVMEERQFIRSNGEVVLIEKAKNISKESVVHLAKHSNLIKEVEDEDEEIKPEKLYIVERLSDYAVYENKFLYYLLIYLRDFINLRYDGITKNSGNYLTRLSVKNKSRSKIRNIDYDFSMVDHNMANSKQSRNAKVIKRIEDILSVILKLLSTPLMVEVAKVAMIKPPITKTNVLRMNNNFKNALALYEYVSSYKGLGYEILKDSEEQDLSEGTKEDFIHAVLLLLFLLQQRALNLKEELKANYEEQIRLEKEAEKQAKIDLINKIRGNIKKAKITPEEYILLLEERISFLEGAVIKLDSANNTIQGLNDKINNLLKDCENERENTKMVIREKEDLKDEMNLRIEKKDIEINKINSELVTLKELIEKKKVENVALRSKLNMPILEDELTSETDFKCIEREYMLIKGLYKNAWKKTKKRLVKEILNFKRGENEHKE